MPRCVDFPLDKARPALAERMRRFRGDKGGARRAWWFRRGKQDLLGEMALSLLLCYERAVCSVPRGRVGRTGNDSSWTSKAFSFVPEIRKVSRV